ncbi:MAG: hypothetical protein LBC74_04980 [Planctomycetaceae bacterium]|nr:hypothetical protein [Planctomycetaceae bacterium]
MLQYIHELDKNLVDDLSDHFLDRFVDPISFEKDRPSDSTQSFKQRIVSRNTFRWCDKKRWEKSVHSGGFEVHGEKISDFVIFVISRRRNMLIVRRLIKI